MRCTEDVLEQGTKDEAQVLAEELGGYARLKKVNGRFYYYAVKNE